MQYVVPNMRHISQDRTMSCWYASAQMLIQWRKRSTQMSELAHPNPSQLQKWKKLYNDNPGITNTQITSFAKDLGLKAIPPMSPTPGAIHQWLRLYGPLWTNGKAHITVIAGIKKTGDKHKVLVYDPASRVSTSGDWRDLEGWYINNPHSGRDSSLSVQTVFLHLP